MSQLTYRLATLSDFEDLYRIKCDKENIAWGGFTKAPEKDSFYQWYLRQLASDCRWIYLVYEGEDCCGFFYVDKLEDGTYEAASSGVLSEYMGKGIFKLHQTSVPYTLFMTLIIHVHSFI